ncbi:MAG: hypothetical protein ACRDRX_09350 [Pseudonocardiaceae bacterium]
MKLPTRVANPVLAVLIQHSGYNSLDKFAAAVNDLGAKRHGLKLYYDHIAVKRWLSGGTCQHAEVVAEVLGRAWNVPIPATVIWPQLRHGARAPAAHLYPCVAVLTLDELAAYISAGRPSSAVAQRPRCRSARTRPTRVESTHDGNSHWH